jgi:hypothetical protein
MTSIRSFGPKPSAGFALPSAIFAMVVIGVLVATGFFLANQERRVGMASDHLARAQLLAETGLAEVLATWTPNEGYPEIWGAPLTECAGCEGVVEALGGSWTAQLSRVGDRLYLIESTGVVDQRGAYSGATRTLGQLARVRAIEFSGQSALTVRGNVDLRGGATVNGNDLHPAGSYCPDALSSRPGATLRTGDTVRTSGASSITGSPIPSQQQLLASDTEGFLRLGDLTWSQLVAGATVRPAPGNITNTGPRFTATGKCDATHTLNWGDPLGTVTNPACRNYFPVTYISGNAQITSGGQGQGILLVDGDLTLGGNVLFRGIIMTRGGVRFTGSGNRIEGTVLSYNAGGSGVVEDADGTSLVGSSALQYSSCAISTTLTNLAGMVWLEPLENRDWIDLTRAGS